MNKVQLSNPPHIQNSTTINSTLKDETNPYGRIFIKTEKDSEQDRNPPQAPYEVPIKQEKLDKPSKTKKVF